MPVRVVLDYPRHHIFRRLWRRVMTFAGAVLFAGGIAASVVAVPSTLLAIAWVMDEDIDIELEPGRTLSADEILLAWAISTPLAILGMKRGRRLVRSGRSLVLFLRRFGYDDATSAVTFAVTRTIGSRWRLVTLDDAEIAPLGVATGTRWFFGVVQLTTRTLSRFVEFVIRVFPAVQLALWGILAADLVRARIWEDARNPQAWMVVLNPYLDIVFRTLDGRLPFEALGFHLHGAFALVAIVLAGFVMGLGVVLTAVPVAWLASAALFLFFFSFSAGSVREAERFKTRDVQTDGDVEMAVRGVLDQSRKIFGPRLVVLRVGGGLWRRTVTRFASESSVCLIDVSEPTEYLVWEIQELSTSFRAKCVFICQYDRAVAMTAPAGSGTSGPYYADIRLLLEMDEILAYTTDRRGQKRFARALRSRLLSMSA